MPFVTSAADHQNFATAATAAITATVEADSELTLLFHAMITSLLTAFPTLHLTSSPHTKQEQRMTKKVDLVSANARFVVV